MASKQNRDKAVQQLIVLFAGLSARNKLLVGLLLGVALALFYFLGPRGTTDTAGPEPRTPTSLPGNDTAPALGEPSAALLQREEYLFCWWNLENYFDDRLDGWKVDVDEEYDIWFSSNPDMVAKKLANLTSVLLRLNNGIGPDILACCEVEDSPDAKVIPRALILLRDQLNRGITDPALRYRDILWRRMAGGRNICNAILTRLPVDPKQTRLVYRNERIVQGVIRVRDQELVVLASHWTSRLTDKTGDRRAAYGDETYQYLQRFYRANPNLAAIVAGDLNDNPEDPSVTKHLWATSDLALVRASGADLSLYNLMRQPHLEGQGTIDGRGAGLDMFDQIIVTPGMVRAGSTGWTVVPESLRIITEGTTYRPRGSSILKPLRFGSKSQQGQRGCSDHLPVVVTLRLAK